MDPITISVLIFALTFLLIITELVHKTLAALLGALLMILYNFVSYSEAGSFIDFRALGIVFGMMVVVEVVKDSGIFQFFGIKAIKLAKGNPKSLFVILIVFTTILSAFLSNQVSILIIAALTFTLCRSLDINPVPFVISEAIIADIGGLIFLTSSTPSILVGGATEMSFVQFMMFSMPFALFIMVATIPLLLFIFRKEFKDSKKRDMSHLNEWSVVPDKKFFYKSLAILAFTMSSAVVILLLSGADPDKTLRDVQWGTLFFFIGLFIVIGGLENSGFLESLSESIIEMVGSNNVASIPIVTLFTGIGSGIVDNIPMTVALIPVVRTVSETLNMGILWWSLLFGAVLGGNLTPIGSPSNVIALNVMKKEGKSVSFGEFMKVGVVVTVFHLFLAIMYLLLVFLVF
jgi:Na+/H+ antiporter NhaD/arsenite permease-like protein